MCSQSGIDNPALGCGSQLETESTMRMENRLRCCRLSDGGTPSAEVELFARTDLIGKVRLNGALL